MTPEKQKPWILKRLSICFYEFNAISVFIRSQMGRSDRYELFQLSAHNILLLEAVVQFLFKFLEHFQ